MIDEAKIRRIPERLAERAREFYASGQTPVEPVRAATVIMLRDLPYTVRSPGGVEVYMLLRKRSMAFAAGLYAFPGGKMGPQDIDVQSAAVREATEETGLRLSELYAWSRWVTPEFEPRRYDTWFYVSRHPEGTEPRDVSGEADWAGWTTPQLALRVHADRMLPPTLATLDDLARYRTVDSILVAAESRDLTPILPAIDLDADPPCIRLPGDPDYPG